MQTDKYVIIITSILIFSYAIFIQFYHMFKNNDKIKYICRYLGGIESDPNIVISWIFIIIVIAYILLHNKKLPKTYIIVTFVIIMCLVLFANLDYMSRKTQSDPTLYSIPHYTFTVFTYLIFILCLYFLYNKYAVFIMFSLFLIFCGIHVAALQDKKKKQDYLKYSIALELIIIYGIIFLLLYSTILNF